VIKIILLNFAHPITSKDIEKIEDIIKTSVTETRDIDTQVDPQNDIFTQIETILDNIGLSSEEWQTLPLIINLPSLNYSTAIMLAMLHGRMGYFPAILRMRPEPNVIPPRFVLAEVINLQAVRQKARYSR